MVVEVKPGRINRLIPVAPLDVDVHPGGGGVPECHVGCAQGTGTPIPRPGCREALAGAEVGQTRHTHMP